MTTPREDRAAVPSVRRALAALLESAAIGSDAVAGGLMSNPHWPALVAAILAEADAAEPSGPWVARPVTRQTRYTMEPVEYWRAYHRNARPSLGDFTEAEARAVANCLNRLSARSRRDEGAG